MAVAVVERFKQELIYGLSAETKKCGRCREVAVVERWPLVEVRLYSALAHEKRLHCRLRLVTQLCLRLSGLFSTRCVHILSYLNL